MNKSITTIIPFFNSGDSIQVMLESILKGTVLPDEILLIDDGSTDNSPEIALDYSNRYPFIRYYRQEHSGVSHARNLGVGYATSNWISFLDADDYVEKKMYEHMAASITQEDLAGCVCGYYTEENDITCAYTGDYPSVIDSSTLLKAMFTDDNVRGFLFTRLFRTDLIKDASFDTEISMCEDMLFQTSLLAANPDLRFAYINLPLYHYVHNAGSATGNIELFKDGIFKYKPAFSRMCSLVKEQYVSDSYDSILCYSMYRLLKIYRTGNHEVIPQIRMLQNELKASHPSASSKRRYAYVYAPILYSRFMK